MRGQGPSDERREASLTFTGATTEGTPQVADLGRVSDDEFYREWERHYLIAVRAALMEVVQSSSWLSESEAFTALTEALERRGIHPDPEAVRAGAELISRGRRPRILSLDLDPGGGRRRRR